MLAAVLLLLGVSCVTSAQNVSSTNYTIESHQVVTQDGYILGVQHITSANNSNSAAKKLVFLMHGFGAASNCYTVAGPEYAIGYNLVEAGFDVWMGNARGNIYSRHHVSLDPDKNATEFFNYSFEEIALYDLPAMFDYVLNITQQKKFYYIGHSQGGTVFMVLNSMNSTYHSKIVSAHLLSGVGYSNNLPNKNITTLSKSIDVLYTISLIAGNVELYPSNISLATMDVLVGVPVPSSLYGGAAVKQLVHFGQTFRDKAFRRFVYSDEKNKQLYGSITPPSYNLTNININVTLHYSVGDVLQNETDVLAMAKAMPKATARKVARETFTHLDYLAATDAKTLVTNYIIAAIKST